MSGTTTASPTDARFARMMGELWEALTAHWSHAFTAKYGTDWRRERTWQEEMRGLTRYQIREALAELKYEPRYAEFPPAARVLRATAIRHPMRENSADFEAVWRNVCDFYADRRPPEAVWIIRNADDWEALRGGSAAAEREFARLWDAMLAFAAGGGQLPEAVKPVPRVADRRERKKVDWAAVRAALGCAA